MGPVTEAIKQHMAKYLTESGEVNNVKIHEVRWVRIDQLRDLPDEKKVYSGKTFEINPKGVIGIMEKLENGKRNETLGFQVTLTCMFNTTKGEFEFTETNHLVAYRDR